MSRAVIDACIPYEQQKSFPKVAVSRPELAMEIARRWKSVWE
jgi:hypothetical protein